MLTDEQKKERVRTDIQDAVDAALENGWTKDEIREEVNYVIETRG